MHQMKLKNCLSYKKTFYREVAGRIRYYSFKVYPTLFNEYILVREYGNIKNKKTTRVINTYFSKLDELVVSMESILSAKIYKGYLEFVR